MHGGINCSGRPNSRSSRRSRAPLQDANYCFRLLRCRKPILPSLKRLLFGMW